MEVIGQTKNYPVLYNNLKTLSLLFSIAKEIIEEYVISSIFDRVKLVSKREQRAFKVNSGITLKIKIFFFNEDGFQSISCIQIIIMY